MIQNLSQRYALFSEFTVPTTVQTEVNPSEMDNVFCTLTAIGVAMVYVLGVLFLACGLFKYIIAHRKKNALEAMFGKHLWLAGNVLGILGCIGKIVVQTHNYTMERVWIGAMLITVLFIFILHDVFHVR